MPEVTASAPSAPSPAVSSLSLDQGVDQLFAALSGTSTAPTIPGPGPVAFTGVPQTLPATPTQDYGTDPQFANLWKQPDPAKPADVKEEGAEPTKAADALPSDADLIEFEGPDGKPVHLTLQDAISAHTELSTLRQELDTIKSQSATMPEEVEQAMLVMTQARQQLIQEHEQVRNFIRPQPPNQELLNENSPRYNPRAYAEQLRDYNASTQWLDNQQKAIAKQKQEWASEQQALRDAEMARGRMKLRQAWPEVFTDQNTRQGVAEVLKMAGYDPSTALNAVTDVRAYNMIRLALKGLQAERAASGALKKVTSAPRLIRAAERTNATQGMRADSLMKVSKTGNVDDALAIPGMIELLTR
jgi:hypothetical protein